MPANQLFKWAAGRAAAIVSDEAGTTRDIVSVRLDLNGVPTTFWIQLACAIKLVRLRKKDSRCIEAAQHANIVVLVADASSHHWQQDVANISCRMSRVDLLVLNKIDHGVPTAVPEDVMLISAQNEQDITKLMMRLAI